MSDIEGHDDRILALLPEVLHPVLTKPKQDAFTEQYEGALLFVDVAGFSAVANQLQKLQNEAEGAESLSHHLNGYFTRLIQVVKRHHGDIIFFSGDAMMVAWKGAPLPVSCAACFRTGAALLSETPEYSFTLSDETTNNPITCTMKLHIGASGGVYHGLVVGGKGSVHLGKWKYLLGGNPVKASGVLAGAGEHGELVVDDTIVEEAKKMKLFAETTPVTTTEGGDLYKGHLFAKFTDAAEFPDVASLKPPGFALTPATKAIAKQYVFDTVIKAVEEPGLGGELRTVFTVFIKLTSLDANLPPFKLHASVNQAVGTIQKTLVEYDGILNKVMMDDKGIICLCLFGVPLHGHENDALRAMQFAVQTAKNLNHINKVVSSIGISKAAVFCGLTGSVVRNEYTCLGDGVNLAARLMIKAESFDNKHPQIIVDPLLTTAKNVAASLASFGMAFVEGDLMTLKGQADPIRCYHLIREKDRDIVMEKLLGDDTESEKVGPGRDNKRGRGNKESSGRENQKVKVRSAGATLLTHPRVIMKKERSAEVAAAIANALHAGGRGEPRKSIAAREQQHRAGSFSFSRASSTGSADKRMANIGKHWVSVLKPASSASRDIADYVSPRDAMKAQLSPVMSTWTPLSPDSSTDLATSGTGRGPKGRGGKPKQRVNVRGFGAGRSNHPKSRPGGQASPSNKRGPRGKGIFTAHGAQSPPDEAVDLSTEQLLDDLGETGIDPLEESISSNGMCVSSPVAAAPPHTPELVGRADEMERCQLSVDRWLGKAPPVLPTPGLPGPTSIRTIIITGEAQIGKSYFLSLLEAHAGKASGLTVLRGRCGASERGVQYAAVRPLLKRVLMETDISVLIDEMPAEVVEVFPLLGHVTRIDGLGALTPDHRGLAPAVKVERINGCVLAILKQHYGGKLFLSIDDLQWLDDNSAAFIMDAIGDPDVFVAGSHRKELLQAAGDDDDVDDNESVASEASSGCTAGSDEPMAHELRKDGGGHARLLQIITGRQAGEQVHFVDLKKLETAALSQSCICTHNHETVQSVDAELLKEIHDLCDGIPGYVLRAVRKLKSSGIFRTNMRGMLFSAVEARVDETLREMVPSTMEASVMSVVDRLRKKERQTATMAAVLGRSFSLDLLVDVMAGEGLAREQTCQAVANLTATGMLVVDREKMSEPFATTRSAWTAPLAEGTVYRVYFLRAAIRDVLYNSLLNRERDRLHSRAAVVIGANLERGESYLAEPLKHQANHWMAAGDLKHGWAALSERAGELKGRGELLDAFNLCAELAAFADKVRGSQWGLDEKGELEEGSGRPSEEAMKAWSLDVSLVCYEAGFLWASDVHASAEADGVFKTGGWDPLMLQEEEEGLNAHVSQRSGDDGSMKQSETKVGETARGGAEEEEEEEPKEQQPKEPKPAKKKKKKKKKAKPAAKKSNPLFCCCKPPPPEEEDEDEEDDDEAPAAQNGKAARQAQRSKSPKADNADSPTGEDGSKSRPPMEKRVSKLSGPSQTTDRSSNYVTSPDNDSMGTPTDTPIKPEEKDVPQGALTPAEAQFAMVRLEIALFMCKPYLLGLLEDVRHTFTDRKQRRVLEPVEHCMAVLRGMERLRENEDDDLGCSIGLRYHLEHRKALMSPFTIMAAMTGDRWRKVLDLPPPPLLGVGAPCSLVPLGTAEQEKMYPKVPRPSLLLMLLVCRIICALFVGERDGAVKDIEVLLNAGSSDTRATHYGAILQSYCLLWFPETKFSHATVTEADIAATIQHEAGFAGDLLLMLLWISRIDPNRGEEMLCEGGCAMTPLHLLAIVFILDDHKSVRPVVNSSSVNRIQRLLAALDQATQLFTFARPAFCYYDGLLGAVANESARHLRGVELALDPKYRRLNPFVLRSALRLVYMPEHFDDPPSYVINLAKKHVAEKERAQSPANSQRGRSPKSGEGSGRGRPDLNVPKPSIRDDLKALGEGTKMLLLPEVRKKWDEITSDDVKSCE